MSGVPIRVHYKKERGYMGDFEDARITFLVYLCAATVLASIIIIFFSPLAVYSIVDAQVAVSDDEAKQERNCGKTRTKVPPSRLFFFFSAKEKVLGSSRS